MTILLKNVCFSVIFHTFFRFFRIIYKDFLHQDLFILLKSFYKVY